MRLAWCRARGVTDSGVRRWARELLDGKPPQSKALAAVRQRYAQQLQRARRDMRQALEPVLLAADADLEAVLRGVTRALMANLRAVRDVRDAVVAALEEPLHAIHRARARLRHLYDEAGPP